MKEYIFVVFGVSKTILLGAVLASVCIEGCVIYLHGNIGTGKSTFCRGFLRKLGYNGYVNSPTYTLIESYVIDNWTVHHVDCYRLNSSAELENIGIRDFCDKNTVFLVEWPKKNMLVLPAADISITINYHDIHVHSRQIVVQFISNIGQNMLESARLCWNVFK